MKVIIFLVFKQFYSAWTILTFIYLIILDFFMTVTTQMSRSSRISRSKGPSKSIILWNKQKEKEELSNQILPQEVKIDMKL